jgi:hypothetical protein
VAAALTRAATPADYDAIARVVDDWWGRPVDAGSAAFHRAMGFTQTGPVTDYNGPGRAMLVFERDL